MTSANVEIALKCEGLEAIGAVRPATDKKSGVLVGFGVKFKQGYSARKAAELIRELRFQGGFITAVLDPFRTFAFQSVVLGRLLTKLISLYVCSVLMCCCL